MSHAQLKARVIKRAIVPHPSTFPTSKEHQLGVSFDELKRLNSFKRIYESDGWRPGEYREPTVLVLPFRVQRIPPFKVFEPQAKWDEESQTWIGGWYVIGERKGEKTIEVIY